VTDPVILDVQRVNPDKIVVTAKNIGFSDLLVWDDYGRWSLGFLGVFPVPEETYQDWRLREEQGSRLLRGPDPNRGILHQDDSSDHTREIERHHGAYGGR